MVRIVRNPLLTLTCLLLTFFAVSPLAHAQTIGSGNTVNVSGAISFMR